MSSSTLQTLEEQGVRLRAVEKHLTAERQLTATLEEALTDLERQSAKVKQDCEAWRRRAGELEAESRELRRVAERERAERDRWSAASHTLSSARASAVPLELPTERKRPDAETARVALEERMRNLGRKKKKMGGLNCF
jgi:chromosome segregation ATPase